MNTTTTRSTAAVAGAALALLLTACGGDGDPTDPEEQMGAIDMLFEEMYGEWDPEQSNQEMIRIEEIIAECMAEEGFDYTPVDYSQDGGPLMVDDDGVEEEWGTLEYAERWGYGITTNPGGQREPEPVDPGEDWVDPNGEYVESMTESEQAAYFRAMSGEQWDMEWTDEMESGEYVWDWTTSGCVGRAQHEVYGDDIGGAPGDDFTDLEMEMQVMWDSITNDPRLAEATGEWATCMAGAGYPGLIDVIDAEGLIADQVEALWGDAYADITPDADEEVWRSIEESIEDEMAAITPDEIKTAVADFTCRDEVGYARVQTEVNIARQQEFYDLHKDELIAWAEAMSGKSG